MTFLNKINETLRTAAEKTEGLTKTISNKANAALDIKRLDDRISAERIKINKLHKKIGETLWVRYEEGDVIPDYLIESCREISSALEAIDQAKLAIAKIKSENFAGAEPKIACPNCEHPIPPNAKFCNECGKPLDVNADSATKAADTTEEQEAATDAQTTTESEAQTTAQEDTVETAVPSKNEEQKA